MPAGRGMFIVLGGLALVAVLAVLAVLRTGLSADRTPGRVETLVARNLVRFSIPAAEASRRNPSEWIGRLAAGNRPVPQPLRAVSRRRWSGSDGDWAAHVPASSRSGVTRDSALQRRGAVRRRQSRRELDGDARVRALAGRVRQVEARRVRPQDPSLTAADLILATPNASTRIVMDGTSFHPEEATVDSGAAVLWANLDPFPHNVTSESGTFTRATSRRTARGFSGRPNAARSNTTARCIPA